MIRYLSLAACLVLAVAGAPAAGQAPNLRPPGPPQAATAPEAPPALAPPQGQPSGAQPQTGSPEATLPEATVAPATTGRDPFWPVGYVPKPPVRPTVRHASTVVAPAPELGPVDWDEARKRMDVRGISRMGRDKGSEQEQYLAIVNGKVVESGDVVMVSHEGRLYRWKIQSISPRGIGLARLDARRQ